MKHFAASGRFFVISAVVVSLVATSVALANAAKASRVRGKVLMSDGKPAASIAVKVSPLGRPAVDGSLGGGSKKKSSGFGESPTQLAEPTPIATARTDAEGVFDFKTIPEGTWKITAGERSGGIGYSVFDVDGSGNDVQQDIQLNPPKK